MDFGIIAGDTDQTIYVRLRDSTTGLAKTGLAYNSAGAVASYTLPGAARAAITLATQTVSGAHSDGGFVEVDATNCKGLYRLDLPDAAIASGKYSIISIEFDGIIEESIIVPLSLRKADVRQNAGTNITSASGRQEVNLSHIAGSAVSTSSAQIGVNVVNAAGTAWGSGAITAASIAADAITAAKVAADVTTEIQSGLATSAALATAQADLDILTGADGAVIASGTQTFNMTGNITGNLSGSVGSVTGAVGSVTGNVGGSVGSVTGAVGSVTGLTASDVAAIKVITDALGATAAARLALSAGQIIPGTVDTTVAPSTTEFEADDITEATADHYNGRIVIFTSGVLAGQATSISDYALAGGKGHFTVVAMTEAPGNNDTFIIV